jgi:gliding motility-associated-like protein
MNTSVPEHLKWLLCCCLAWLALAAAVPAARGQNLVPNGSFEQYSNCPTFISMPGNYIIAYSPDYLLFPYVDSWVTPAAEGTPDFYHACGGGGPASIPRNLIGYQPARTGRAYAGIIGYYDYNGNAADAIGEALSTKLTDTLIRDSAYCVTFYVSPALSNFLPPAVLNEIGAHLSDTLLNAPAAHNLTLPYHIVSDTSVHMTDTARWYEVKDFMVAKGGERFLTIGRFRRSAAPAFTRLGAAGDVWTYSYIDDVSVVKITPQYTSRSFAACDSLASGSMTLHSSLPAGRYKWNTGDTTRSITIKKFGLYFCKASAGCDFYLDTFRAIPSMRATSRTFMACDSFMGGSMPLTSSLPSGSYRWSTGDTARSIRITEAGNYTCRAEGVCEIVHDTFYAQPGHHEEIHYVPACDTGNIDMVLTASVVSSAYTWSTGDTGRYLHVTKNEEYRCSALSGCRIVTDIFRFYLGDPPPPKVRDTTFCFHAVDPKLAVEDTGLVWYTTATGGAGSAVQPLISTDDPGRIQTLYVAKRTGNCLSIRVPVRIMVAVTPEPHALARIRYCDSAGYYLPIGVYLPGFVDYSWNTGQTACCITPNAPGIYIRTASNVCGTARDTVELIAEACTRCMVFPSGFSPNGDGRNDNFGPLIRCPAERFKLNIYNRWGMVVFSTGDQNSRWQGLVDGKDAPVGVYMYWASFINPLTGREMFEKGEVTLVR